MESENNVRKIRRAGFNRKKLSEITNSPVISKVKINNEDCKSNTEATLQKVCLISVSLQASHRLYEIFKYRNHNDRKSIGRFSLVETSTSSPSLFQ
jgi:hypothetical protein